MASTLVKSHKMKRLESKKSHSWWWDSHISPKNSRWLQENLEEMDQNVKRMLKLIEEDADSFAKKAEMYYQKRPELIHLVEEFYRMYRSLAERYDQVTGELRKNVPSDLQSQGSGISEAHSEPPSICPSPDQRPTRRRSGHRAAGFDFFLGTGVSSSELGHRDGDESSTLDSDCESDDSSVINYSGVQGSDDGQGMRRKIIELEVELRGVKEKLQMQQEDTSECSSIGSKNGNFEILNSRIAGYEVELRDAKEKLRLSEEEIDKLRADLHRYESMDFHGHARDELETVGNDFEEQRKHVLELEESTDGLDAQHKIMVLVEELKNTNEKLHDSEKEVAALKQELNDSKRKVQLLQDQLGSAKKDVSTRIAKIDKHEREVSKLQDRITRYKSSLSDRDQEIRRLKEAITNASKSLSEENSHLQAEVIKLLKERSYLESNLKELDHRCQSFEEDVRRVKVGKSEMEALLGADIDQLKATISERNEEFAELNENLELFRLKYDMLMAERDELNAKVEELIAETSSKEDRLDEMNNHLHQLHMEHVKLITETEGSHKLVEEQRTRIKALEMEVKRQQELIQEGAEEKREAIRQLCFSLEHYRNGYHRLRKAVISHKMFPVMAS